MEKGFSPIEAEHSLRDLLVEGREASFYERESLPADERLSGQVLNVGIAQRDITLNSSNLFLPQIHRREYEQTRKGQVNNGGLTEVVGRINSLPISDDEAPDIVLPEARASVSSVFIAYDSRTGKFYKVSRVNNDRKHNPLAGIESSNATIFNHLDVHPGALRQETWSDIIPFQIDDSGTKRFLWPYSTSDSRVFKGYKDNVLGLMNIPREDRPSHKALPAFSSLYHTIGLPGAFSLSYEDAKSGRRHQERGYEIFVSPTGTLEMSKATFIGDLAQISGFHDGQWDADIVVESLDDALDRLGSIRQNPSNLTAQYNLETGIIFDKPSKDSTIFDSITGAQKLKDDKSYDVTQRIYAPNLLGILRKLYHMKESGIDPDAYITEVLRRDYGIKLER